jgi:GNAT superfamily N-acetyltransferase
VADDEVAPMEVYLPLAAQGLVWVAAEVGQLIGFASSEVFEGELHLWELAVRRESQGRGVGRALIAAVAQEARKLGLPVTLTTFRDIPWNAPFYARCGFVEMSEAEFSPLLKLVFERQAALGLDVANRCAMRLSL